MSDLATIIENTSAYAKPTAKGLKKHVISDAWKLYGSNAKYKSIVATSKRIVKICDPS